MGKVIEFKPNLRTIYRLAQKEAQQIESLQEDRAAHLYAITRGFDPWQMNQIPEYRQYFDEGFYET